MTCPMVIAHLCPHVSIVRSQYAQSRTLMAVCRLLDLSERLCELGFPSAFRVDFEVSVVSDYYDVMRVFRVGNGYIGGGGGDSYGIESGTCQHQA